MLPPQRSKTLESHSTTSKKGLRLAGDIVIDLRLVGEYLFFLTRFAEKNKRSLKDAQHSKEPKRAVLAHMHTHTQRIILYLYTLLISLKQKRLLTPLIYVR